MNEGKKIFTFLNAYTEGLSGADNRFIEVFKRIEKIGYRIIIVTSKKGEKMCIDENLTADFIITTKEDKSNNVFNIVIIYIKRILSSIYLISKRGVKNNDVCYSTSDFLPDVLPCFILKIMNRNKNIRWISLFHLIAPNPFVGYKKKGFKLIPRPGDLFYKMNQIVSVFLMKLHANIISVDNSEIKKYLESKGISSNRIIFHKNGVDLRYIQKIEESNHDLFDGIFLGRIHPQKGILDLIEIWEQVCANKPRAKLGIIGEGEKIMERKLKNAIKKKQLEDNIKFLGFKKGKDKFSLLKSSKLFIFPSHYESFGQVILEAMACGLPVVAYDLSIYDEFFHGNIKTIPQGDIQHFSEEILTFLNDPMLCRRFGAQGISLASEYDWDEIAKREIEMIWHEKTIL